MPVYPDAGPAGLDASTTGSKDAGTPGGPDGGHVVTPGTWSDYVALAGSIADGYCAKLLGCGMVDQAQLADCKAVLVSEILDPQGQKSVETGASIYDSAAGNQCLGFINTLTCSAVQDFQNSGCDSMIVPGADLGDRCYFRSDCKDNTLYCIGPACAQTCQDHNGTVPPGQPCDYTAALECDTSLGACNTTYTLTDAGWKSSGVCVAYLADGQSCNSVPSGAVCRTSTSFCDYVGTGLCHAKLDVGGACTSTYDSRCKTGLYCKQISTGDAGFVGLCAAKGGPGAACTSSSECAYLACDQTSMTCQPYEREVGESCTTSQYCNSYAYCKGVSMGVAGICTLPASAAAGEHCATASPYDALCNLGLFCDPATATCKARYADGAGPCNDMDECKIPMHCVTLPIDAGKATGTCRADQAVGQSCANADCLAMYTCDPTAHVCLGPQPNGSTCDNDRQCVSNNCAYPTCVAACP